MRLKSSLRAVRFAAAAASLAFAATAMAEVRFQFADPFGAAEEAGLRRWIGDTADALAALVGRFPFDVHVRFHRSDGAREPVPWANTLRDGVEGVSFHVDPAFALDEFRRDWTAPHELGHLVLPYLGRRHAWFAEGFASYLQYEVMIAMGVLTRTAAQDRYRERIARARRRYPYSERAFASAAPSLRAAGDYPTLYWGGAVYFLLADATLRREKDIGLPDVLRTYLACCRGAEATPREVARAWDGIAGSRVFTTLLDRFEEAPGLPDWPP